MKKLLSDHKTSIENQYSVNVYEQDEPLCKWTVKGEDSAVEAAYQELLNLLQMPGQDKTYIIEDKVTAKVTSSELRTIPVDLRKHIRCRSITVDDGLTVRLYNCSLQNNYWLGQNTLILNVEHNAGGDTSTIKCTVNAFQHDYATIYLPIWKIAKENVNLHKLMTEMKEYFKSTNLQGLTVMSFDLSEVEKVRWPVVQFLGAILLSLDCSRLTYFQFFAPSDDIFEPSSDIITEWCQLKKGSSKQKLQINVVKGELALMKCDVLVNATNREFDLSRGMVSKALLKTAGVELQHDCDRTIKGRQIQFPEVVVTAGYNLSAKNIFHGVLPRYKSESSIQFEYFIKNCLNTAVDLNMKSIAFPALGTGNLIYPPNIVASSMFLVVDEFASDYNGGALTEINFVIFPADTSVLQIEDALNTNGKTNEGIRTDRLAQLEASYKHDSKYPKGYIQYLQRIMNAKEDISDNSLNKRQGTAYSSNTFSTPATLCINEKMVNISPMIPKRSPILYRPTQDSIVMITKEEVKVFVYKADICYLSNVDCIVNPYSS
ncbi:PARP10_14_15 [Mytilus coruscus]|uniref:PARP10_14_15 n=1 Tax=Mytilus coruscus TaxID=42192 RepID=A0A6J8CB66_MYTCO|nr:PARP10_14_15 [Mytilus coruscus]